MADQPQDQQRDPLLEQLTHAIAASLNGPAPTAPTPPQQMGLPPLKAAAAAMNPQFAPLLLQQQNAPAQALYQQQLDAFNQAMLGRREALQSGTQLATAGIRSQAAVDAAGLRGPGPGARGQIRVVEGPDGKPALQEFVADGAGGFTPGKILATGPDTLRFLATPEGYVPVSSKTGAPGGYVQKPGGGAAMPVPTNQAVTDVTRAINMKSLYDDALSSFEGYVSRSSRMQRATTSAASRVPVVGGLIEENVLSYSDPEGVDVKRKIDNLSDILLRLRSGAQINESEFQRLRSLLPRLGENPQTAIANFRRFHNELLTTLRARASLQPNAMNDELLRSVGLSRQELLGSGSAKPASLSDEFDAWSQGNAP